MLAYRHGLRVSEVIDLRWDQVDLNLRLLHIRRLKNGTPSNARAGKYARIPFPVHPHTLRHACGYKLANDGHDTRAIQHYLGHRNITHTVRYTELSPDRFRGFWKD